MVVVMKFEDKLIVQKEKRLLVKFQVNLNLMDGFVVKFL